MENIQELVIAFTKFEGVVTTKLDDIKGEMKILHERVDKRDAENQDLLKRVTRLESTQKTLTAVIRVMGVAGVILVTWFRG